MGQTSAVTHVNAVGIRPAMRERANHRVELIQFDAIAVQVNKSGYATHWLLLLRWRWTYSCATGPLASRRPFVQCLIASSCMTHVEDVPISGQVTLSVPAAGLAGRNCTAGSDAICA